MERQTLIALARETALRAHCPYSHFRVGAVVVADGQLFHGVNVEISSFGLTLCAERNALSTAITVGASSISHIAISCLDAAPDAPLHERTPCGACRQWFADLAPQAIIWIDGIERDFQLSDLLPYAFTL